MAAPPFNAHKETLLICMKKVSAFSNVYCSRHRPKQVWMRIYLLRIILPWAKANILVWFVCYRLQRSCGKVMFYTCLSFCSQLGGVCHTPWADPQANPRADIPSWAYTPLPTACWDTHPTCPLHAGIRLTSGWYTYYWNAFLFFDHFRFRLVWIGLRFRSHSALSDSVIVSGHR